jgi:hypothetical protein
MYSNPHIICVFDTIHSNGALLESMCAELEAFSHWLCVSRFDHGLGHVGLAGRKPDL